jgi:hypothetical protein
MIYEEDAIMALTDLQNWIMRELAARGGTLDGMPVRDGTTVEQMEEAIHGLRRLQYLEVVGPPNQNSDLGKDIDELRLQPYGVGYLRTIR